VVFSSASYKHVYQLLEVQVFLAVIAVRNIPASRKDKLFVRLKMQNKASSFHLDSVPMPASSQVTMNQQWTFEVEASTGGFILGLWLERSKKHLFKPMSSHIKDLGQVHFSWRKLLESPSLAYNGWVNIENSSSWKQKPSLFISVSVTPPQVAPQLMRTINSVPTDDAGSMLASTQEQREVWLTRIVLDHANREVCMIRIR
jgi:hypothetical protein